MSYGENKVCQMLVRGDVLEVNTLKTNYIFMFCHQHLGENHSIKIPNP